MKRTPIELPQALVVGRALVFYKTKLLLIKRVADEPFNPLKWEIPGGKLRLLEDPHDLFRDSVMREAGIDVDPINKFVYMDCTVETHKSSPYYLKPFINLVGFYKTETQRVKLSGDHTDYKWVTFPEAIEMDLTDVTRKAILALETEIKNYLWKF